MAPGTEYRGPTPVVNVGLGTPSSHPIPSRRVRDAVDLGLD
ncbi:MAG TPA: hypothetical protein VMG12_18410 [Polyangiaceae bacterium]|nr:hypothetical protein [Polyangiaceae bacterium]